jgi:hypothetical protein
VGGSGELPANPRDPAKLKELAARLGLESAVERVLAALRLASAAA